jgi:predicted anti-sigma-YlaC factor YlaD
MSGDCDRARQWASTELDGELSTFERVLLRAHLADCPACRDFRSDIGGLTEALREAPLEPYEGLVEVGRLRRRPRLRLAPAAAAMAVAAVGLGSFLASSAVRSGPVAAGRAPAPVVTGRLRNIDTMNLRTSQRLERLNVVRQIQASPTARSMRGGPVLQER